ncbi:MAG TPA: hypothetical protein VF526_02845, partial [Solirubrobacteraceae bacterium]
HFVTRWWVAGTAQEVSDVLGDAKTLPAWWPSVYLHVRVVEPGDADGIGRVLDVYTKGWLPYTLRWRLTVTEPVSPQGFAVAAAGDFVGTGVWTFTQHGPEVEVLYDWRIRANKALLKRLTWLMRPMFCANHLWAMKRGEESLVLELRRRRGVAVGSPPGPTFARLTKQPTG